MNGISAAFCRTEAGQTAAIIFLFVTMIVYLIGAMVCLKMWRHEVARRYRERYAQEVRPLLDCSWLSKLAAKQANVFSDCFVFQMQPSDLRGAQPLVGFLSGHLLLGSCP